MGESIELWDLFDENRKTLNRTVVRGGERFKQGEYHVVIEIWTVIGFSHNRDILRKSKELLNKTGRRISQCQSVIGCRTVSMFSNFSVR